MKKLVIFILFIVILMLFIGSAAAKEINKDFHETFHVKKGDVLYLTHGDGDVNLIPWDKDLIDVEVHFRADVQRVGIGHEYHFDVEFNQRGNSIYVTEKESLGFTIGFSSFKTYEYIYEIKAPNYIRLDFNGDDGDVNIEGWRNEIECRLDMEDGDARVQNSVGSFDVTSDDGDVVFDQTQAEKLYVRVNDGNLDLDLLSSENIDADIKTDDGPVRLNLEKGFSTSFYTYSEDGRIRVELENIENFEDERHSKSGAINGGRGRIRIRTSDGNITLGEK
jgi:hypothetical protein